MEEARGWSLRIEQPAELELAAGRGEEVLAPDDQVDPLVEVVHHHRELVGPVAVAVAQEQVAALLGRDLAPLAEEQVVEDRLLALEAQAPDRRGPGSTPRSRQVPG